jgi:2-polyprenyl-3-methyl-5-hydroxy-6-metoxy-1,4-benzoquinol methylase
MSHSLDPSGKKMTENSSDYHHVREHYADISDDYVAQYDERNLETHHEYPANYFRLKIIKNRLAEVGCQSFVDAGLGAGIPAIEIARRLDIKNVGGFDFTTEMVDLAKKTFASNGLDPARVELGDITDCSCFEKATAGQKVDAALALGVLPHIENELATLKNMASCLTPGGRAFVSFRNKAFSMFTMNRYTRDFFLEELLHGIPDHLKLSTDSDLQKRFAMDKPEVRTNNIAGGVGYDQILSKMHNPFEMDSLFKAAGFTSTRLHWYHYHPVPPMLNGDSVTSIDFRKAAMALEGETSGWRGIFLCSAFVVEAVT